MYQNFVCVQPYLCSLNLFSGNIAFCSCCPPGTHKVQATELSHLVLIDKLVYVIVNTYDWSQGSLRTGSRLRGAQQIYRTVRVIREREACSQASPKGKSLFCYSMFPKAEPWETLRFEGNKINCFPREHSLSDLLEDVMWKQIENNLFQY